MLLPVSLMLTNRLFMCRDVEGLRSILVCSRQDDVRFRKRAFDVMLRLFDLVVPKVIQQVCAVRRLLVDRRLHGLRTRQERIVERESFVLAL